jgi:hypothetical protein
MLFSEKKGRAIPHEKVSLFVGPALTRKTGDKHNLKFHMTKGVLLIN